jgi:hypothetical protein
MFDNDKVRQSVVFARHDLRLIAWMLAAMLIMLALLRTGCIDHRRQ